MDTKVFIKQYVVREKSFSGVTVSEANPLRVSLIEEKLSREKLDRVTSLDGILLLVVSTFLLIITGTLIFIRLLNYSKARQNRITILKHLNQVPCSNCRFFTNNPYLKCAVHPSIVLKAEAINCPDYWTQDGKFTNSN